MKEIIKSNYKIKKGQNIDKYHFKQFRNNKVINEEICYSSAPEHEVFDWLITTYFIHSQEGYYFAKIN